MLHHPTRVIRCGSLRLDTVLRCVVMSDVHLFFLFGHGSCARTCIDLREEVSAHDLLA